MEEWKDCEELKPKPKEKWIFVDKKSVETKHRTEWCAEANKYRCMRCGRGRKYMKMPGKCTGPKNLHVAGQVQLDYDEDMATCMDYGSMEAELEVQRTIKRTELTAFPCLLKRMIGPTNVYVDSKGIDDGLWRGERLHQAKSGRCRFMV